MGTEIVPVSREAAKRIYVDGQTDQETLEAIRVYVLTLVKEAKSDENILITWTGFTNGKFKEPRK